ncbi:MAG: hypothetical protein ACREC0_07240 [Methylocella sp.]
MVTFDGPGAGAARPILMVRRKTASRQCAAARYSDQLRAINRGWHKKNFEDFAGGFSGLRLG